ncbi:MAG TPA: OmpA family protein [Candidatus Acidoferrum sp.]|nr:OmpA family protein [Candidatus Acidoferrum sp.]
MKKDLVWGPLVAAMLVCAAASGRAQNQDIAGKDHPLVSRYPGSYIREYDQKEFDEFELPVGSNGPAKPCKMQHLEGKVTLIRYIPPKGRSMLEVFRNYELALQKAGFAEIFKCTDAAECGAGDPKHLGTYGNWKNHYMAAKLSRSEGDVYAAVNISQSNEGDLYLAIIELKPMESGLVTADAASLAGDITKTGHASVYGIYFDTGKADVKPESDSALGEISKLLQQDAGLKLYVVGHTDNVGTLASNMDLSKRRSDAVVKVLTTKYNIAAARLSAQGDGPTAPVASNDSEDGRAKNRRVELVKE